MLSQDTAARVLKEALRSGADFAEIFMEDTGVTTLRMADGRMEDALSGRQHGAGVRVLKGLSSAYAYTNDTSEAGLLETARAAAQAVGSLSDLDDRQIRLAVRTVNNAHPIRIDPFGHGLSTKADAVRSGYAAARGYSDEIVQANVTWMDRDRRFLIANSEGLFAQDRRVNSRFVVMAVAGGPQGNQIGFEGPGAQRGLELLDFINPEERARTAAKSAVTMLHAPYCPAGRFPVVIDGGFGGVIFHEACGHSLEATSVSRGASVFSGKLGQKIANERVSAVDDGTLPNEWGSINIDDEGYPAQRNVLIENGILKGYMIDRLGGRRMDSAPTGSSRRESYKFAPTSRMTNTFICAGQDDDEEMIATMGRGVYCKKMGGGSVNPATGEFNFAVQEGYFVENGKIDRPVRGATLIGKGDEILFNIDRVGREVGLGQGMCGSVSGSVPTNVGQPRIRVSEITVGGKEE